MGVIVGEDPNNEQIMNWAYQKFKIQFREGCLTQGSVGRDDSSWDGPRPSSSSGRDEDEIKLQIHTL